EDVLEGAQADVAVVTTSSSADALAEHIEPFLRNGIHVVTSCEELAFPFRSHPRAAAAIDAIAKKHGAAVLATGVNPGFVMDFLPLAMSGILRRVDALRIERIQDASRRRGPFVKKIGAGLTIDEFRRQVAAGVLRHVGLLESMDMIACRL